MYLNLKFLLSQKIAIILYDYLSNFDSENFLKSNYLIILDGPSKQIKNVKFIIKGKSKQQKSNMNLEKLNKN